MTELRLLIASRIMAGFAANPRVFAPSHRCGWDLMDMDYPRLACTAIAMADALIDADKATP